MLLYGASGHAKVICSAVELSVSAIVGIFDDNLSIKKLNQYKVIGQYSKNIFPNVPIIISIGKNSIRHKISKVIQHDFCKCIASNAFIDLYSTFDIGTVVLHGATIQRDTLIGKHCIINTNASIDHDCFIANFVHISPGATLCGNVIIGEGTHIGANATINPGIKIGRWCVIGSGSVIVRDVPDFSVVVGNPGRVIKIDKNNEQ